LKFDGQLEAVDIGHVVDVPTIVSAGPQSPGLGSVPISVDSSVDPSERSVGAGGSVLLEDSSDAGTLRTASIGSSTSGLLYGAGMSSSKTGNGALFGKSSSLLFPTGVDAPKGADDSTDVRAVQRQKINLLLDQCESVRWPYRKKLMLNKLGLRANDVPIKDLYGTNLGNTLYKLSLSGNRLSSIPPKLVTCLPTLKSLDLSQCHLHQLPERWNLPQLKLLNLSHNLLTDFPEEVSSLVRIAIFRLRYTHH
jgi:Leucine-rich repeat (LRR) protein